MNMNTMITFIGLFLAVTDSSQTSNCTDDPVAAIKEMDGGGLYFRELFHDDNKSDDDIYDGGNGHGHMEYVGSTLRSLRVHVRIVDGISKVTMVQEFQTPRCVPASFNASGSSALYRIPMDELAAVTEFRAEVENRTIQAVVKERREAQDEFDAAVEHGTTAYLAEQSRADVFHLSVGHLPVTQYDRTRHVGLREPARDRRRRRRTFRAAHGRGSSLRTVRELGRIPGGRNPPDQRRCPNRAGRCHGRLDRHHLQSNS